MTFIDPPPLPGVQTSPQTLLLLKARNVQEINAFQHLLLHCLMLPGLHSTSGAIELIGGGGRENTDPMFYKASKTDRVIRITDFIGDDSPLRKVSRVSTWVKGHGCTFFSVLVAGLTQRLHQVCWHSQNRGGGG